MSEFKFFTPAQQIDFPDDATKQAALEAQWNENLSGFSDQGINGNPWTATNASNQQHYANPARTPIPNSPATPIEWNAFPGRISFYFPAMSNDDKLSLADTGKQTDGTTFPVIPPSGCGDEGEKIAYGPYGPRGWQDEYCEWAVQRDPQTNAIIRIDLTCENPEYWSSLWMIDPNRVVEIYRETLGKPQIQLTDLYVFDASGKPVTDPSTGNPLYNPLNKWNAGPVSGADAGGAMHLTSTPNTLQTEIGLAAAATVQRTVGNSDPQELICCAEYGQPGRNSDPHIGQSANQLVSLGKQITLSNPPGLYIQEPDFGAFKTPDGTSAATFWSVLRGKTSIDGLPGNFILHAKFEVPADKGYTVSDITINGDPIAWGAQLMQTVQMHILASAQSMSAPAPVACVGTPEAMLAQPLQLFHAAVFAGYQGQTVMNPVDLPMNLSSNSTLIAPKVLQGGLYTMVLTAGAVDGSALPAVSFDGAGISAVVTASGTATYAVPGNSYPGVVSTLTLEVKVAPDAALGLHGVAVTNAGASTSPVFPAAIHVVAASG